MLGALFLSMGLYAWVLTFVIVGIGAVLAIALFSGIAIYGIVGLVVILCCDDVELKRKKDTLNPPPPQKP